MKLTYETKSRYLMNVLKDGQPVGSIVRSFGSPDKYTIEDLNGVVLSDAPNLKVAIVEANNVFLNEQKRG